MNSTCNLSVAMDFLSANRHEYMNVMYNNWCGSEAVLQIRIKLPDSATSYLA
jgi:hypothetical protein